MCHKSPFYIDVAMNVIIISLIIVMHFSPPELNITSYSCYSVLPFSKNKNVILLLGNLSSIVSSPLLSAFFYPPSCGLIIIVVLPVHGFHCHWITVIILLSLLHSLMRSHILPILSHNRKLTCSFQCTQETVCFQRNSSSPRGCIPSKGLQHLATLPIYSLHLFNPYPNLFLSRSWFVTGMWPCFVYNDKILTESILQLIDHE